MSVISSVSSHLTDQTPAREAVASGEITINGTRYAVTLYKNHPEVAGRVHTKALELLQTYVKDLALKNELSLDREVITLTMPKEPLASQELEAETKTELEEPLLTGYRTVDELPEGTLSEEELQPYADNREIDDVALSYAKERLLPKTLGELWKKIFTPDTQTETPAAPETEESLPAEELPVEEGSIVPSEDEETGLDFFARLQQIPQHRVSPSTISDSTDDDLRIDFRASLGVFPVEEPIDSDIATRLQGHPSAAAELDYELCESDFMPRYAFDPSLITSRPYTTDYEIDPEIDAALSTFIQTQWEQVTSFPIGAHNPKDALTKKSKPVHIKNFFYDLVKHSTLGQTLAEKLMGEDSSFTEQEMKLIHAIDANAKEFCLARSAERLALPPTTKAALVLGYPEGTAHIVADELIRNQP